MTQKKPDAEQAIALYEMARELHLNGDVAAAREHYKRALPHHPRKSAVYNDLGVALRADGHPKAAIACYRRALADEPDDADTWSNLGNACLEIDDNAGGLAAFRKARELDPDEPLYMQKLGMALWANRRFEEAVLQFEAALACNPDDKESRLTLSTARLHLGQISQGFADYEVRLDLIYDEPSGETSPIWQGDPLQGRTLLVQSEQGLGDVLQFSRFLIPLQKQADGPIIGQVQKPLLRLFQTSFPEIPFVAVGDPVPPHHVCVPFPSLPAKLGIERDGLVPALPYLLTKERPLALADTGRPKVGLTWSGNREKLDRSCPFPDLLELTEVAGVDFYSFQRGAPLDDIAQHGAEALITDLGSQLDDFADDAALVQQLDLVITVDTSFCHLAGALDVPCWVLLTRHADWRFLEEQSSTPWYPSMTLFRIAVNEGWPECIRKAKHALVDWANRRQEVCKFDEGRAI